MNAFEHIEFNRGMVSFWNDFYNPMLETLYPFGHIRFVDSKGDYTVFRFSMN